MQEEKRRLAAGDVSPEDRLNALGDLRALIELSRRRGALEDISSADPHLEVGALYELSLRDPYPPLLLFDELKGFGVGKRILMNARFSDIFTGDVSLDGLRKFRTSRNKRAGIPPVVVSHGPVLENVQRDDDVDISIFPAAKWHEHDGGAYIGTEVLVIARDPDTGWTNIGTYRVQVQDKKTVSVFIEPGKHGSLIREKWWALGKHCPMVICVGQAPVLGMVAGTTLKYGECEFDAAGARLGKPIEVIEGELTGLPFPATAEIAFEGFMPPPSEETRPEGPFAEWPGYYATNTHPEPVVRIGRVYYRNDPILLGQPPAKPTFPGRQPSFAGMAALWDALENAGVPGVKGVWKPLGGGVRFINVISIEQLFQGHAKMAGLVATGAGPGAYLGRITIVVDEDIDITNMAEVMWALATRWDPKSQTDIIDGCYSGYIDPVVSPEKRAANDITSSRIIIYAVKPWSWREQFPRVNTVAQSYSSEIEAKWKSKLGFLQN